MSTLKAFLQPPVAGKTNKVIVSERFKGEDGQPVPFVIQAISQEKNEELSRLSREEKEVKDVYKRQCTGSSEKCGAVGRPETGDGSGSVSVRL